MKKIFVPLIALFLSLQAHAAIHTVKFVDAGGHEPTNPSGHEDQHCQLVNCDDNTIIEGNHLQLTVGDVLKIITPKCHYCWSSYYCAIGQGTPNDILNLKTVSVQNDDALTNCFNNINLLAIAPGVEEMDIHFTQKTNYFNAGADPLEGLLGHITITVVRAF